eukprot:scaffold1112_cov116-Isochrysis_galbana.AAC.44
MSRRLAIRSDIVSNSEGAFSVKAKQRTNGVIASIYKSLRVRCATAFTGVNNDSYFVFCKSFSQD